MRCPHCLCIVDRSRPGERSYRAWCFVCDKWVKITNEKVPYWKGAKCNICGKKASFNHETEERTCCDPEKPQMK